MLLKPKGLLLSGFNSCLFVPRSVRRLRTAFLCLKPDVLFPSGIHPLFPETGCFIVRPGIPAVCGPLQCKVQSHPRDAIASHDLSAVLLYGLVTSGCLGCYRAPAPRHSLGIPIELKSAPSSPSRSPTPCRFKHSHLTSRVSQGERRVSEG
jgi:hypothetical protein